MRTVSRVAFVTVPLAIAVLSVAPSPASAAWLESGSPVCSATAAQVHESIATDGSGGAIVSWLENNDVFAQHVLATGSLDPVYPATGLALCILPSQQGGPEIVATGGAGAIVTWADDRSGVDSDIFALQVTAAATAAACLSAPVPLPAEVDDSVRVSRSGSDAVVTWSIAAGAASSGVLRGLVRGLSVGPGGGDELCLANELPAGTLTDPELPTPGGAFWYLVRGENLCGPGPYGFEGVRGAPGAPRESATCP